jgi:hypothetical protein
MPLDAKALADATAEIVTRHVTQATAPLVKRIEQLEARPLPERGEKGDPGDRGEPGLPGVSVKDAFRQEGGVLILTLSDGTTRDLGPIVGPKGEDGKDGRDGSDGTDGQNGRDGFSLDDFDVNRVDGRTIILSFTRGDVTEEYELRFPFPVYRGVFKDGEEYGPGDMATWGGSLWHCDEHTKEKPDVGPWRLAVKKGRDGKDAK